MAKPKLKPVRDDFLTVLKSSEGLFKSVSPYLTGSYKPKGVEIHRKQAEKIVALAFMSVVSAWEEFVIDVFLRYLTDAQSPSGYKAPLRLGACSTIAHATDILSGKDSFNLNKNYLAMTNWDNVLSSAKIYFSGGAPFSNLTSKDKEILQSAVFIRNRIAHTSPKCVAQFLTAARNHLGLNQNEKLPQGTDPGRLLTTEVTHLFPLGAEPQFYYQAYSTWFSQKAHILVP